MPRIAGLICSDFDCPADRHHLELKTLCAWERGSEADVRHVQIITPHSSGQVPLNPSPRPRTGHQPLWDEEGRWALLFEGTLYNAADLRTELSRRGRHCHSATDAELVLQAFAEWDAATFGRLRGLFAIALYDRQSKTIHLARDLFGQKPLFYMTEGSHLCFASELDLLVQLRPAVRLNKQSILEWSLYRNLASEATFFEDIFSVRPGHHLKFAKRCVETVAYASLTDYVSPATYERFAAAPEALVVRELEEALARSVADCLTSEGVVGTCCSGGVDSSLVTALAARTVDDLAAFHASATDNAGLDERPYAEEVAKALGVRLACCPVERATFQEALVEVISLNGMPLSHIHLVAFALMVRQAYACGVRVLLTGDAADGQFGGLWHRHRRQPQLRWITSLFARLPRRLRNALALAGSLQGGMPFTMIGLERLIPNAVQSLDGYARSEARLQLEQAYAFVTDAESRAILVTMLEDFMDSWDIDRADRLGAGVGVECRSPFVHPTLVALSFNLPVRYRFRGMTDKWLLKKIAAHYLPRKIVYSKKRPWDFPWRDYLAPFARVAAFRGGFCTDALHLSTPVVEELITSWETNVQVFWNILNLEMWGRLFYQRESIDRVANVFLSSTPNTVRNRPPMPPSRERNAPLSSAT